MEAKTLQPSAKELYDADFLEWTVRNAELLRARRFDEIDLDNIIEEIESLERAERRRLRSTGEVLLAHLLKWRFQPARRGASWKGTIRVQRLRIGHLIEEMPSLRPTLPESVAKAYQVARAMAAAQSRLPEETFPSTCPFRLEQILDDEFFPE